ncbi:MAG: EAL domain-containing protein [Desulfuromonadales bacterium]|nr:MAG: EAL domain-containing protein [Desulfuromonadales bacterium]
MKIRNTLVAGCFIFAMLTAVVGFFGSRAITKISGEFDTVAEEVYPVMTALDDIRFAGLRIVASSVQIAVLAHSGSPDLLQKDRSNDEAVQVESGIREYHAALKRLKALGHRLDDGERRLVADIEAAGSRLLVTSANYVVTVRPGSSHNELFFSAKENLVRDERLFLARLDRMFAHEAEELAEYKQEVRDAIKSALITIAIASMASFLVAIGGGSVIAASISRPIASLHDGVVRVSEGLLDTKIKVAARNEIGTLADAFNRMTGELQSAKNEIVTTSSYLDNIIRSMPDALLVISPEGTITCTNPALCAMLGYREDELTGLPFATVMDDRAQADKLMEEMVAWVQLPDREVLYRSKEGTSIPVVLSGGAMAGAPGEIQGIVCIAHNITGRKRAEEEIRRLAYFDPLTGLPNRTLFQNRLDQTLAGVRRDGGESALLFLDLDRFKDVNDSLGHACGDLLLAAVADRLKEAVLPGDFLARLGGDEFVVILAPPCAERCAADRSRDLLELLVHPFEIDDKEIFISTSIGIALFPGDGTDAETLFKHADMALYAAKEGGRNSFGFFSDEMNQRASERRIMEDSLRRAIHNDELFVEYQPQIDMRNGRIFGVETLLRWNHPEEGPIPPARFIPVAEETGLIRRIGEWVLRSACLQCRQWQEAGLPPVQVAVNVSGHQFNQPGFIEMIDQVLEETGIDPTHLELELTESTLMEGERDTIMTLIDLKVRGLHLAIDDFGTGYSSLSYLKHFPIDRVKIDRSFVRDIVSDLDNRAIVEAIIAMAHTLGLRVLAEGVEREEELELLRERNCDEVQGFFFDRPMPARDVAERLAAQRPAVREVPEGGA